MTGYSKYATTVVGSYSVPRWYESLEKEVEAGKLSRADMADVQDPNVEAPEVIAERITRLRWLTSEQTLITSSCGMNHLRRGTAFGKLKAMTGAKQILLAKEAKSAA
jgi:methionine synthase II (cobalamin-independent)